MTSQGRHRTVARSDALPFLWVDSIVTDTINEAICQLQAKGYEVRALRLHFNGHGQKVQAVFWLSPAPVVGSKKWSRPEYVGRYHGQNVGTTRRRNLDTLLAYVEGLPDVRQAGGQVDAPTGGTHLHQDADE